MARINDWWKKYVKLFENVICTKIIFAIKNLPTASRKCTKKETQKKTTEKILNEIGIWLYDGFLVIIIEMIYLHFLFEVSNTMSYIEAIWSRNCMQSCWTQQMCIYIYKLLQLFKIILYVIFSGTLIILVGWTT